MKVGIRKPSIKKSVSARTTGKVKRKLKRMTNPFYGKKGVGWIRNPKRALYNKAYRKTTVSAKKTGGCLAALFYWPFLLCWWVIKYTALGIWWMFKGIFLVMWWMVAGCVNLLIWIVEKLINIGRRDPAPTETTEAGE